MNPGCISCFFTQANKLLSRHNIKGDIASGVIKRFTLFIEENKNKDLTSPEYACFLHRLVKEVANSDDLYKEEKKYYNDLLLNLEEEIRYSVLQSGDPFKTALQYAVAGNIIDFGPPKSFDIKETLASALTKEPAINHSSLLKDALHKASKVLYLGDNAGEIVLDKIFIEIINHPDLCFAVRGGKVINDVSLEDAEYVGMNKIAKIISNGYDAPSTLLKKCSPDFVKIFNEADIIISKGQGNLEGLIKNNVKRIFFLLMVKCEVMSEITGVQEGDVVILDNRYCLKK